MRNLFIAFLVVLFVMGTGWTPSAPPPIAKLGPGYVKAFTALTLEDTTTGYHEIDGWFWEACTLSIQVAVDTLVGGAGATTDLTVQASNDLTDPTPTWISLWSTTDSTWVNNKDTVLYLADIPYARYRFKYDLTNSDTANVTIKTWLIVKP